jgi:hypothetical protein
MDRTDVLPDWVNLGGLSLGASMFVADMKTLAIESAASFQMDDQTLGGRDVLFEEVATWLSFEVTSIIS